MTSPTLAFLCGPAAVIDDHVDEPEGALVSILEQLAQAQIPTVKLRELPSVDSLEHWKQFGLIVLDWELSYSGADADTEMPAGLAVPETLQGEMRSRNFEFIRFFLEKTALPIFIASNEGKEIIESELAEGLLDIQDLVDARVKVFHKSELTVSLLDSIEEWFRSRPALQVLRAWNRAYVEAEIETFHDFSQAQEDWVESVIRAARADEASLEPTLHELLAKNIINRVRPMEISLDEPSDELLSDASALRKVLHLSAVVPASSLNPDEPSTGDLFVRAGNSPPYSEIRILLTPECDLVRGDRRRFVYLTARLTDRLAKQNSSNRVSALGKPPALHLYSNILTALGDDYVIKLRDWHVEDVAFGSATESEDGAVTTVGATTDELWPDFARIGRLLDPFLTQIQQQFALVTIRKGLPRQPLDFYN